MLPLEAVPNFSEGRDRATIDAIGGALAGHARLLDVHSDEDHNRSVYTLVGSEDELVAALLAGIACARERIDLRRHEGAHPRIGAADVVPLVPIGKKDAERARTAALELARRVGEELALPVFLYGDLATDRGPAFFRRGGPQELRRRIDAGELAPDFGPAQLDERAGAVIVGARAPLIDVRHFRDSGFTGAALTNALAGAGLMVALVFIPVLAQSSVFSLDPRQASFLLFRLLLGIPIGALAGGVIAGRLRSNRGVAAIGMLIAAFAFALLAGWNQDALRGHLLGTPLRVADLELFSAGLGLGLEIAPVSAALLDLVSDAERGAAAAFLVIARMVGMLLGFSGVAGFGLYQFDRVTAGLTPPLFSLRGDYAVRLAQYELQLRQAILDQYHTIFTIAAALVLAGAVIAAASLRPPRVRA